MFDFFEHGSKAYAKRSEAMLREALFARLEHEAAAEHHQALARMYAERIDRLQREALSMPWSPPRATAQVERRQSDRRLTERGGFRVVAQHGPDLQVQQNP